MFRPANEFIGRPQAYPERKMCPIYWAHFKLESGLQPDPCKHELSLRPTKNEKQELPGLSTSEFDYAAALLKAATGTDLFFATDFRNTLILSISCNV